MEENKEEGNELPNISVIGLGKEGENYIESLDEDDLNIYIIETYENKTIEDNDILFIIYKSDDKDALEIINKNLSTYKETSKVTIGIIIDENVDENGFLEKEDSDNILKFNSYFYIQNITVSDDVLYIINGIINPIISPGIINNNIHKLIDYFKEGGFCKSYLIDNEGENTTKDIIKKIPKISLPADSKLFVNIYGGKDFNILDSDIIVSSFCKSFHKDKCLSLHTYDEDCNKEYIILYIISMGQNRNYYVMIIAKTIQLLSELQKKGIVTFDDIRNYGNEVDKVDYMNKAKIIIDILELAVKNKLYNEVISFAEYIEEYNLQVYDLRITDYFILIGASYQEVGNLEIADEYFDKYIACIEYRRKNDEEYEKQIVKQFKDNKNLLESERLIGLMFVIQSLGELGIDYKLLDEYD